MKGRFEVVRTAQEQWHARFIGANGRTIWWTENYKRKVGAEKAISAIAHVFYGWIDGDSVTCLSDRNSWEKTNRPSAELRYIDDRLKPMPRPELPALGAS